MPTMSHRSPHYLLFTEASTDVNGRPRWRFVLQSVGGADGLAADDAEPTTRTSRLELLAVVRGLEALAQPSRVTLVTRSRYVRSGLRRGLSLWREGRWQWERFGHFVPIRDHDLWRRVDRALEFHDVHCHAWQADAERQPSGPSRRHVWPWAACREGDAASPCRHGGLAAMVGRLRHGILTPLSTLWPQAFTRAA